MARTQVTVKLGDMDLQRLRRLASQQDCSQSEIVRRSICLFDIAIMYERQ